MLLQMTNTSVVDMSTALEYEEGEERKEREEREVMKLKILELVSRQMCKHRCREERTVVQHRFRL